jgi:hypothetical protein
VLSVVVQAAARRSCSKRLVKGGPKLARLRSERTARNESRRVTSTHRRRDLGFFLIDNCLRHMSRFFLIIFL